MMSVGADGLISFNNHIPKLLKRIYLSYSLFFIGCSMNVDRTVQTFEKIVAEETARKVPEHYALLEAQKKMMTTIRHSGLE
jgi:ssDNA-binding Zn-finger/Zn-ribbon topoisomerase 1